MPVCLIGLGSNQGNRRETLDAAVARLAGHPRVELLARSAWRETAAVGGPADQPPFLNGAVKLETSLGPGELLELLRHIETQFGRRRTQRWGPRSIDLDLLLYGDATLDGPELTLPHPRMAWRRFVLGPAAEAAGEMVHPTIGWSVARLLEHLDATPPYIAVTGGIAAGKSRLAERLAAALHARCVRERPDWTRLDSFYADPAGRAWETEMAFLDQRAALLRADAPEWQLHSVLHIKNSRGLTAPGENYRLTAGENNRLTAGENNRLTAGENSRGLTAPGWSAPIRWTISDFWFEQSAAFARAWLPRERMGEYMERFEQLRPSVARPRLIVLLDVPAETLFERVRQRGRACERRLTVEQLERIRRETADQASRPGLGPVLRFHGGEEGTIFSETLAAAQATM